MPFPFRWPAALLALGLAHGASATHVHGHVRDALTSAPLGGTQVLIQSYSIFGYSTEGTTSTDADGSYGWDGVCPQWAIPCRVSADREGYVIEHVDFDASTADALADLALRRVASISGAVRDATGPLAGISVDIDCDAPVVACEYRRSMSTDSSGQFAFGRLPGGSYRVCATPPEGSALMQQCWNHIDTFQWAAYSPLVLGDGEQRVGVDFDLDAGGSIRGRLTDAHLDAPLSGSGVGVSLYDENGDEVWSQETTTADDGQYTVVGAPQGRYRLALFLRGGGFIDGAQVYPGIACGFPSNCDPSQGQLLVMAEGGVIDGIDFSFHPDVVLHGRVVDGTTGSGVGGAIVGAYHGIATPTGTIYQATNSTTTQASGAYELYVSSRLSGAQYFIAAEHAPPHIDTVYPATPCIDVRSCLPTGLPLTVHAGDTLEGIDIATTLGGALSGTVRDQHGQPLPGSLVYVFDQAGSMLWHGNATADGTYTTNAVPAATYFAMAESVSPTACTVWVDRRCPGPGLSITSVNPTPLAVQSGVILSDTDFVLDTDMLFTSGFEP